VTTARKIVFISVIVLVLGIAGGYAYLLWAKDDAPAALSTTDLDQALTTTLGTDKPPATTTAATAATAETTASTVSTADAGVDGTWTISQDSTLGYRVQEVLGGVDTEGAGRTNQVTGELTIAGTQVTAVEFTVDMASVTSDSDRRDGQFRSRIMSTDEFPTSTFVLTSPIDIGATPAEGVTVEATATGDLTLRGVTNSVTFPVQAKLESGRIGVLGTIPVRFSDYGIPDPSNAFAAVKDNGTLEFVLVLDRA
jgi:polyisoprenoid-binding protein YceI